MTVPPRAAESSRSAGHALVIVPDAEARRSAHDALEGSGWLVSEVATGLEGVTMAGSLLPDVIVCDWSPPGMDGLGVVATLAEDAHTSSIPVVLLTRAGRTDDIARAIAAGAHDYAVKPFARIELEARCRTALRVSRQQRALTRCEHELHLLRENTSDLVARCGLDGRIRYMSPSSARVLGWDPDALVGQVANDLTHPEDDLALSALARGGPGETVSLTRRLLRSDGEYVWVDTRAQVVTGPEGDLEILSVSRDVAEVQFQEEVLSRAEERWRGAFEEAPVGMAELDIDGRFVAVNPALCEMLGFSAHELLGLTPMDISHPDDAERTRHGIADVVSKRIPYFRAENRCARGPRGIMWCAVSAVPVHDRDGRVERILTHYVDVSDLKRVESELQHLAVHDPLTGLLNSRGFREAIDDHLARVDPYGPAGALLMLDLDGLKEINETVGNDAGDEVIKAAAVILERHLRTTGHIARLGGAQFGVILPNVDSQQAGQLAAALTDAVRIGSSGHDPRRAVTASVGVALFSRSRRSAKEVVAHASRAMYVAKGAWRERVAVG